jgi:hypothetical protein
MIKAKRFPFQVFSLLKKFRPLDFQLPNSAARNKVPSAMEFAFRMENRLMFSADDSYE